MKTHLLTVALVVSCFFSAHSQCSDLFISEYVEGWNNNKAIEIYNPTSSSIDMSGYQVSRYSNGSQTPSSVTLSGTIAPYAAVVLVIDKQDTTLTGQDTAVWADLAVKADYFLCPDYNASSAMYFNGNDAVTLEKTNSVIVDIFGKVGEDPGSSWTDEFPYTDAQGNYWTKDQTLIRKSSIKKGVTSNPSYFDPTAEWDSMPANYFDALGCHRCECDPDYTLVPEVTCDNASSVKEVSYNDNAYFFPNPSIFGKTVHIKGTSVIEYVELYNSMGDLVYSKINNKNSGEIVIDVNKLNSSIYFVRVVFDNKRSVIKELSVK